MRDLVVGACFGLLGVLAIAMILSGCAPKWTQLDEQGDKAAESLMSRIYALDAGDEDYPSRVRAYAKPAACAVQQNLVRHDAGRLIGPIQCVEKRE